LAACVVLSLAFDHRYSPPIERVEQPQAGTSQPVVERDAFAIDADTAARRLLPQAAMGEHGDRATAPAQREEPLPDARDVPLQQDGERRRGEGGERAAALDGIGNLGHRQLAPDTGSGHH